MDRSKLVLACLAASLIGSSMAYAQEDEAQSRPSWRSAEDTPELRNLPPEVERPDFEFNVERTEFERPTFDPPVGGLSNTSTDASPDLGRVGTWRERRAAQAEEVAAAEAEAQAAAEAEAAAVAAAEQAEIDAAAEQGAAFAEEVTEELLGEPTETQAALAAVAPPVEASLDLAVDPANPPGAAADAYRLRPLETVSPDYPRQAYLDRDEGWVDVEFVVQPDGSVSDVNVVEANPRRTFDRAALRAASGWRFQPPSADGVTAEQTAVFRFEFNMDG
ncbi:MAG: energy transducer TonB [Pseudomonadota bacterium]